MTLRAVPTGFPPGRAGSLHAPGRVLEALRHEAVTELGGVLSGFWSGIEEQVRLAALAGHDYVAVQEDRVAVMALSHRALELATRFREAIEAEFERWEQAVEAPEQRERSLTLMSESELEVHLAGQQITELLDHQFLHPLAQLDERLRQLSAALGVERRRPNPLRPEVAVNAFVSLFGPEDLTAGLRTMVFQQFDKRLPKVLGELYEKANAILDKASFSGVAPEARRQPVRGRPAAAQPHDQQEGWVPDGGVVPHLGEGGGGGAGHARRGGHAEAGGHGGTGPGADGAAADEGRHASPASPAGGAGGFPRVAGCRSGR